MVSTTVGSVTSLLCGNGNFDVDWAMKTQIDIDEQMWFTTNLPPGIEMALKYI